MAVTKTHPIKSTLKAAIDYICNPEKTDGKLLVSSYGCAAETADIEFAWTRRHAIDKGMNLGRHLIQAFQPGEVTPEQAHEIGIFRCRRGTHPGWPRACRCSCRRQGAWETSAATIKVRWRSCHAPTPQAGNTNGRTEYPAFARSKIVLSSPILMKPATFSPSTQWGRSSVITRHISGHR